MPDWNEYYKNTQKINIYYICASSSKEVNKFEAHCAAPEMKMWDLETLEDGHLRPVPDGEPITDPMIFIDALVHSADIKSGRKPVHDPDAVSKLLNRIEGYKEKHRTGKLNMQEKKEWETAVAEFVKREKVRMKVRIVGKWADTRAAKEQKAFNEAK
jgi:hypothetical protein